MEKYKYQIIIPTLFDIMDVGDDVSEKEVIETIESITEDMIDLMDAEIYDETESINDILNPDGDIDWNYEINGYDIDQETINISFYSDKPLNEEVLLDFVMTNDVFVVRGEKQDDNINIAILSDPENAQTIDVVSLVEKKNKKLYEEKHVTFDDLASTVYPLQILDEAKEFIQKLPKKDNECVLYNIQRLGNLGHNATPPLKKDLTDEIKELRTMSPIGKTRILYFFFNDNNIVFTHGFKKKTQKTPKNEIEHAENIRKQYYAEKNEETKQKRSDEQN